MSETAMRSLPASPELAEQVPPSLEQMKARLVTLRKAGELSPEGCRLLAQAEAVEMANREMAGVKGRLEARLKAIDVEAEEAKRKLQEPSALTAAQRTN